MLTFDHIIAFLSAPGVKGPIEQAAPSQHVLSSPDDAEKKPCVAISSSHAEFSTGSNITGYAVADKKHRLDRWLDLCVRASGSQPVFLILLAGLMAWAFAGIVYYNSPNWAVFISDFQAIISYLFDSLLMRQQLNSYDTNIRASASLRSRAIHNRAMLHHVFRSGHRRLPKNADVARLQSSNNPGFAKELPDENMVGRISTATSKILGHFGSVIVYWISIFVWIGFGHSRQWSNEWQLYCNSATSALMVLIFTFLANIRERHSTYLHKCLDLIFHVDSAIELKLRTITGITTPNPTVVIPAPKISRVQRAIFYYADVVGTLVGVAILIIVIVVWLCIGPVMHFNSNWWLLIGTYAGLVGLNDGFVLRNVQARFDDYQDDAMEQAVHEDMNVYMDTNLPWPNADQEKTSTVTSINERLSTAMGAICGHDITVVLGFLLIVGLLIGSSAMKWTETGQLLCNVPSSIIESFFMLILITGHNISDSRRRTILHNMYMRRLTLLAYVDLLGASNPVEETPAEKN